MDLAGRPVTRSMLSPRCRVLAVPGSCCVRQVHTGYPLRLVDEHDIALLDEMLADADADADDLEAAGNAAQGPGPWAAGRGIPETL